MDSGHHPVILAAHGHPGQESSAVLLLGTPGSAPCLGERDLIPLLSLEVFAELRAAPVGAWPQQKLLQPL